MMTLENFGHVSNKMLRDLIAYWLDKRCDRLLPARHDIDPIDIPWALAQIWMCDVQPEDGRYRYRLAGEQINAYWGYNIGGKYLDEIVPEQRLTLESGRYLSVSDGPSIVHDIGWVFLTEELCATGERIILPLSRDGQKVDTLLGATCRDWFCDQENEPLAKSSQTMTVTPLGQGSQARSTQKLTLNCSP
jgi:hypothetical protein